MQEPLLPFASGCMVGRFLRREKRFLVEFSHGGERLWAHTNNSGSMLGLLRPGYPVLVSKALNPNRKLPFTLELVNVLPEHPGRAALEPPLADERGWVGVNTLTPNRILKAAFFAHRLPFAQNYTQFKPEVTLGASRMDALMTGPGLPPLWVECKNVTLVENEVAAFPDAVTERGHKHLREMIDLSRKNTLEGVRTAFFYCIQYPGACCFAPADYIDPVYSRLFYEALEAGVEVYPYAATVTPAGIDLGSLLPVLPCACYE